ncbi:MAG: hypothetical protein ACTICV_08845 [Corynebacterium variabile]|uniref:hypothetical protein n=1 Tax=Corynebacterium variabile TaxID=1727 RepID=UPI003F8F5682
MTAPELAKMLNVDTELQRELHPTQGLNAAAFQMTPPAFTAREEVQPITANDVTEMCASAGIEPVKGRHGYKTYSVADVRAELGLSPVAPTAVRRAPADDQDTDEPATPRDVDSIRQVAASTGIPADTITALVSSGAVTDHSTVPGAGIHRARVSAAEVQAAAEHGLGLADGKHPDDLTGVHRAAQLSHVEVKDLQDAVDSGQVPDHGTPVEIQLMDGTGRNVDKTIHRTARPRVSIAEVQAWAQATGTAKY